MKKVLSLLLAAAACTAAVAQDAPKLSYTHPDGTLYFGVSPQHTQLTFSVVVGPVFSPITWHNTSNIENASYEWYFQGNDNGFTIAPDSPDGLTFTYHTDYSSELSKRNNHFYTPELRCNLNGEQNKYSRGRFYQAGGTSSYVLYDGTYNFGMTVFDLDEAPNGLDIIIGDNDEPAFGYNSGTDAYWGKKQFGNDFTESATDYAHLKGFMNLHTAPAAPLVVNGAWVAAKGHNIPDNAQFTLEVIGLDNLDDLTAGNVLASAKISGENVLVRNSASGSEKSLTLPFTFEQPLVIDQTVCKYYLVRVSDFRSRSIPYFAPLMSTVDNPDGFNLGYYDLEVSTDGNTTTERATVESATGRKIAFAIMLDAEWPWLVAKTDKVSVSAEKPVTVTVDSFYELADLEVEGAPEWLTVELSGRLGSIDPSTYAVNPDGKAVFSCSEDTPENATATVTVSGPGVSQTFEVTASGKSGIEGIAANAANVKATYNVAGMRVDGATLTPGIYLQQMTDGTVRKICVK